MSAVPHKKTKGFLSLGEIKKWMATPFCVQRGHSAEVFEVGEHQPKIEFAGQTLINCPVPIEVDGIPLVKFEKASEPGGPFLLTATFYNSGGDLSLEIVDNEWRAQSSNWDVEVKGRTITIRDAPGNISLRLVAAPPDGLAIEKLDMHLRGLHFFGDKNTLNVTFPNGNKSSLGGNVASNCAVGLSFETGGVVRKAPVQVDLADQVSFFHAVERAACRRKK
jgi:hypothetical protein